MIDSAYWTMHRQMIDGQIKHYERLPKTRVNLSRLRDWQSKAKAWDENRHSESKIGGFSRGILGGTNRDCICGKHWVEWEKPTECPEKRDLP